MLFAIDTSFISSKANALYVYTKRQVDSAFSAKANQTTTYSKTEVDNALSDKPTDC